MLLFTLFHLLFLVRGENPARANFSAFHEHIEGNEHAIVPNFFYDAICFRNSKNLKSTNNARRGEQFYCESDSSTLICLLNVYRMDDRHILEPVVDFATVQQS